MPLTSSRSYAENKEPTSNTATGGGVASDVQATGDWYLLVPASPQQNSLNQGQTLKNFEMPKLNPCADLAASGFCWALVLALPG